MLLTETVVPWRFFVGEEVSLTKVYRIELITLEHPLLPTLIRKRWALLRASFGRPDPPRDGANQLPFVW